MPEMNPGLNLTPVISTYERVKYISELAFGFDFEDYLTTAEKSLLILEINTLKKIYHRHYGYIENKTLETVNKMFFDANAGYLFDAHRALAIDFKADLLLLSDVALNSNPIDLDAVIIHELTHFLMISGNKNRIEISPEAKEFGKKIYEMIIPAEEILIHHTEEFCAILAQGCGNYQTQTLNFKSVWEAVESAMRFDAVIKKEGS